MNHKRIITGLAFIITWGLILLSGHFGLFWLTCMALGGIMLSEFYNIVLLHNKAELSPTSGGAQTDKRVRETSRLMPLRYKKKDRVIGTILAFLPLIASYTGDPEIVVAALFVSLLLLIFYTLNRYSAMSADNSNSAGLDLMLRLGFGVFYVGFCGSHFAMVMARPHGVTWLVWLTLMIAAADTGAYYTGKLIGKTKLCPAISPGKTREGFLGGMVLTVSVAITLSLTVFGQLPISRLVPLTILIFCIGVMGDLNVSIIKRAMGVKDSGTALPGHGGVLDRLDSVLLTIPVLFYLLHFGFLPPSP